MAKIQAGQIAAIYLKDYRFHGDVDAFSEGTIMFSDELILSITAPLLDAQLVETAILTQVNHQSLIATKAARIVRAAEGRAVSDFGARRAHNIDAAVYGARAAFIGGADGTATVMAGEKFGIPVGGTMAHSWIMYYDDEYTAFSTYAELDSYLLHGVCTDEIVKKKIDRLHARNRHKLAPMPAFMLQDAART